MDSEPNRCPICGRAYSDASFGIHLRNCKNHRLKQYDAGFTAYQNEECFFATTEVQALITSMLRRAFYAGADWKAAVSKEGAE